MKILNLKIYNPCGEEIRNIDFNPDGASIIFGKIKEPDKKKKTTNSIGKTLLLKFISYILGRRENKNDYAKKIVGWQLKAIVLYQGKKYTVTRTIGDTTSIMVDNISYSYNNYLEFFHISTKHNKRQMLLYRRQSLISDVNISPTKEETATVLALLKLNNVIDLFMSIRNIQEKVKVINDYSNKFKDTLEELKEKEFLLGQEKDKIEKELQELSNRIKSLNIAEDTKELIELHAKKSYELKTIKIKEEELKTKIIGLNELLEEMKNADLSASDVIKIYQNANIEVPDMVKKTLNEVQKFYDDMFNDKINQYSVNIEELNKQVFKLQENSNKLAKIVDGLAQKIAENNLFKEAMNLYQLKNEELLKIEREYNQTIGCIKNLQDKKNLQNEINQKYIDLESEMKQYDALIDKYRKYIYNLVNEIYGENNKAYFDINVSSSPKRIESSPIVFDLNLNGEFGEGVNAVKNVLMDLLLFYFNTEIEFLLQDSACFEGIDKRQLSTILAIIHKTAIEKDKQYIFSINEYHINNNDIELQKIISERVVISLSEDNTLLKFRF